MSFNRIESAELAGKTAIVRVDFNVPRDADGNITDDTRIRSALPTIQHLQGHGAKTVLLSHFGRPEGQPNPDMSLRFIVPALEKALGETVTFVERPSPDMIADLDQDAIVLVENTRFSAMETQGDPKMAKFLASLGDVFIMDAFSASHRKHASSAVIGEYLPSYAGLAMERELDHLAAALDHPETPVMALVGGAKVSTKIDLLENLVSRLDTLVIGGGMANTFLYAQGHDVGASLCEKDLRDKALDILKAAEKENCRIVLPVDVVVATEFKANAESRVCGLGEVKTNEMILDAGPDTVSAILDVMDASKTLIWNGPLGAFEMTPFDTSTVECAKYAAKLCRKGNLICVAGGGDTVAALALADVLDDFTFISTAGGAFLEWMEGKTLPGVDILKA
ncbi:phosphoglycerate kinase [Litorimonas cladophorae]|uniref:Phosphoglycerate kinase n=1 Tax=Litorimonas cladophorae TaxID=1220491 RepID=A0A918KRJ3_9PROT|nr:phosphoglycerate kinase [Litorimonas cladophorae]GGX70460.1 phosphoglycerate kinase [Litorimonas cladophorae]